MLADFPPCDLRQEEGKIRGGRATIYKLPGNKAAKILVPTDYQSLDEISTEVRLNLILNHPGIVRCEQARPLSELPHPFHEKNGYVLVFEKGNGDLYDILPKRGFSEAQTKSILRQLLSALEYVHGKGYAHRDIKPENIITFGDRENPEVKLGDWGYGSDIYHTRQVRGTFSYLCPEMVREIEYWPRDADMWTVGVLTYELLTGENPFEGNSREETWTNISNLSYTIPSSISPQAADLIQKLLCFPGYSRLSAKDALRHPFLN